MKRNIMTALFFTSVLSACAGQLSEATHISNEETFPPTEVSSVSVLFEAPEKPFTVIGLVESHGVGLLLNKEEERSLEALKAEAASMGANAVIVTSSKHEVITGIDGDPGGRENIISAKAIRYK